MKKRLLARKLLNTFAPNTPFVLKFSKISGLRISFGSKAARERAKIWTSDSHYKPDMYSRLDTDALLLLNEVESATHKSDKILDICCNTGRHINYLTQRCYSNVHGFDIMKPAIEGMPKIFPAIDTSKVLLGNAIDVIPAYADSSFDWAYTHTATIELIHPSFNIYGHLKRILTKGFIFLINENGHSYPRFYTYLAEKSGFRLYKRIELGHGISVTTWVKTDYFEKFLSLQRQLISNPKQN